MYRSLDNGVHWTNLNDGHLGAHSGPIKSLAFSTTAPNVLVLGAARGVFVSIDDGNTWTNASGGLAFTQVSAVAFSKDQTTLYAATLGGGVFTGTIDLSTGQIAWGDGTLAAPVHQVQVVVDPASSDVLYASAYPGGVFKSTNRGLTWSEANFGLPTIRVDDPTRQGYYALALAPSDPDVIYLGIYGRGVYKSEDGAGTWLELKNSGATPAGETIASIVVDAEHPEIAWAASEHGVLETTDGGVTWNDMSTGLDITDFRTLVQLGDGSLLGGSRGNEIYAYHSPDDPWVQTPPLEGMGEPWPVWDRGLYQFTSVLFHPQDPNRIVIGTFPAGVFRSEDSGATWRERNVGFTNDGIFYITHHPEDPAIIYAGTYNGINRSLDYGDHWEKWNEGWPPEQWVFDIAFSPGNASVMYACSKNGHDKGNGVEGFHGTVMKSTDGGAHWTAIRRGLRDQEFYGIKVDPNLEPDAPDTLYLAAQKGFYRSATGGAFWRPWQTGLLNVMAAHPGNVTRPLALSKDGRYLFLGTNGSGVFRRRIAP